MTKRRFYYGDHELCVPFFWEGEKERRKNYENKFQFHLKKCFVSAS